MGQPYLNCFDKAALALAMLDIGEVTSFDVYVSKWFISLGVSMDVLLITLILKKVGVVGTFSVEWLPLPNYTVTIFLILIVYLIIHYSTHSAGEIKAATLSGLERWTFTLMGILIIPLSGIILILIVGVV